MRNNGICPPAPNTNPSLPDLRNALPVCPIIEKLEYFGDSPFMDRIILWIEVQHLRQGATYGTLEINSRAKKSIMQEDKPVGSMLMCISRMYYAFHAVGERWTHA